MGGDNHNAVTAPGHGDRLASSPRSIRRRGRKPWRRFAQAGESVRRRGTVRRVQLRDQEAECALKPLGDHPAMAESLAGGEIGRALPAQQHRFSRRGEPVKFIPHLTGIQGCELSEVAALVFVAVDGLEPWAGRQRTEGAETGRDVPRRPPGDADSPRAGEGVKRGGLHVVRVLVLSAPGTNGRWRDRTLAETPQARRPIRASRRRPLRGRRRKAGNRVEKFVPLREAPGGEHPTRSEDRVRGGRGLSR